MHINNSSSFMNGKREKPIQQVEAIYVQFLIPVLRIAG
jgi:hypothetical protein